MRNVNTSLVTTSFSFLTLTYLILAFLLDDDIHLEAMEQASPINRNVVSQNHETDALQKLASEYRQHALALSAADIAFQTGPDIEYSAYFENIKASWLSEPRKRKMFMIHVKVTHVSSLTCLFPSTLNRLLQSGTELSSSTRIKAAIGSEAIVLASPILKARVYIICRSPSLITERCNCLPNIFLSSLIPISTEDQEEVLLHIRNQSDFRHLYGPASWVRLRRGLYADDLALVTHVDQSDKLRLLIVPRINNLTSTGIRRKRTFSDRPQSALMTNDDLKRLYNTQKRLHPRQQYTKIGRLSFHHSGLLALTVMGIHAVTSASPSATEITLFTEAGLDTRLLSYRYLLQPSDSIVVTEGHFQSAKGHVLSVSDDYAEIALSPDADQSSPICTSIHLSHLSRTIVIGDYARISLGSFAGHEGVVIATSVDFVTISNEETEVCYVSYTLCIVSNPILTIILDSSSKQPSSSSTFS